MAQIDYTIRGPLFPFNYGVQHLAAVCTETTWEGRVIHLIVGVLEWIPGVNYIIALFDRILGASSDVTGPTSAKPKGGVPPHSTLLTKPPKPPEASQSDPASKTKPLTGRVSSASKQEAEDAALAAAFAASLAADKKTSATTAPPKPAAAAKPPLVKRTSDLLYQELTTDNKGKPKKGSEDKLKGFGILGPADLKALGVDEFDEIEAELTPLLREVKELLQRQIDALGFEKLDEILRECNTGIEKLDQKDIHYHRQVHTEVGSSAEALGEYIQKKIAASGLDEQVKSVWEQLYQEIEVFRSYCKTNPTPKAQIASEVEAFKALHTEVRLGEQGCHKVQVQKAQLAYYRPKLEAVTKRLTAYLRLTQEFDDRGLTEGEQAALVALKTVHESALCAFTDPNSFTSLATWHAFLQEQLGNLRTHKLQRGKALFKAYELQQDVLKAWKKLKEMSIISLSDYRTQFSDQTTKQLLNLDLALSA